MSHSDIRVVPGPANYYSHPGSLARLQDFIAKNSFHVRCGFTASGLSQAPRLFAGCV